MQSVNTVTHYFDHSITVIQSVEFACIYLIYNLLSGKILYYFNSRQKGDVVVFLL